MLIRPLVLILILEELKPIFPIPSAALSLTSSITFYFYTNLMQFDIDIVKINFAMTYLTRVVQDWFEVGLN